MQEFWRAFSNQPTSILRYTFYIAKSGLIERKFYKQLLLPLQYTKWILNPYGNLFDLYAYFIAITHMSFKLIRLVSQSRLS
jgi:hypothetical protein